LCEVAFISARVKLLCSRVIVFRGICFMLPSRRAWFDSNKLRLPSLQIGRVPRLKTYSSIAFGL